jgi:flagellar FliJ protein
MHDFKFKLQAVLRMRERERDQASQAVQQAQLALHKLHKRIDALQLEYTTQQPLQTAASGQPVDTQRLLESQRYQMHITQEILNLQTDKNKIQAEIERRRLALIDKEKQVRSLEKLKERQLAQFRIATAKKEQLSLDEWAGFQHWQSE